MIQLPITYSSDSKKKRTYNQEIPISIIIKHSEQKTRINQPNKKKKSIYIKYNKVNQKSRNRSDPCRKRVSKTAQKMNRANVAVKRKGDKKEKNLEKERDRERNKKKETARDP